MTTWDEEKTPTVPHSVPYRAPVVMPGLLPRASAVPRVSTPQGLGPTVPHSTLAPLCAKPPTASCATLPQVSSKPRPPPLPRPAKPASPESLPSLQRLMRTWDRLSPENRALLDAIGLALLPSAVDASKR